MARTYSGFTRSTENTIAPLAPLALKGGKHVNDIYKRRNNSLTSKKSIYMTLLEKVIFHSGNCYGCAASTKHSDPGCPNYQCE